MTAMGTRPFFSVITACYNSAATLPDALASVQNQNGATTEHLIVDGGSTDGSLDVAAKVLPGEQIVSEPDDGIYDAMNKGIGRARGEVVAILNADDFYADADVLEDVQDVFSDKEVDVCYGDLCYVDYEDTDKVVRYWKSGEYKREKMYWGWMPPHPTFFVRKSVYERYGVFKLDMGSAADYELMLRFLVRHRLNARYIPKVLVKMRTGGVSNSTVGNRLKANHNDRKAWGVNGLKPYPWTLFLKPVRKIPQWWSRP